MPLLDFNSLVICNNNTESSELLKETLDFFSNIGIKKFIVLQDIDPAHDSQWYINNQLKNVQTLIRSVKPRGVHAQCVPNIWLSPSVTKHPILQ